MADSYWARRQRRADEAMTRSERDLYGRVKRYYEDEMERLGREIAELYERHGGEDGVLRTLMNNNGGVLGGITTGMPVVFNVAIKPTASIFKEQDTVNVATGENVKLSLKGRHDPCIVVRALPVIEAAAALAVYQFVGE